MHDFKARSQPELVCVRKGLDIADDDVCGFSGNKGRGSLERHKYRCLSKLKEQKDKPLRKKRR
jgi:hypothetical protein